LSTSASLDASSGLPIDTRLLVLVPSVSARRCWCRPPLCAECERTSGVPLRRRACWPGRLSRRGACVLVGWSKRNQPVFANAIVRDACRGGAHRKL
jgi:hypothetical protein